jgi:ribosomal protein S18 acetylase RimI-like enzyme
MSEARPLAATIRSALSEDADGIARVFMESAEYHAHIDPERYFAPAIETIAVRYREAREHLPVDKNITLVGEINGEIVGFIDAGLEQSPDLMHREIIYCHVSEIAVSSRHQNQGIGRLLLQAAENWGREMGAAFASLEFHAGNKRASLFYQERMGYHPAAITAIKRLQP